MSTSLLACDGCGQAATPEHVARRLHRLELATRWRPIHIGTLLLGGHAPQRESDFLYAGKFEGEAGHILEAVGLAASGKAPDAALAELQRAGYFLAHMLDCPLDGISWPGTAVEAPMAQRVAAVAARIRRSLKPRRVVLISTLLAPVASKLRRSDLGCPMLPDDGIPFGLDTAAAAQESSRLREALGVNVATR